jgi:hypothetical protein
MEGFWRLTIDVNHVILQETWKFIDTRTLEGKWKARDGPWTIVVKINNVDQVSNKSNRGTWFNRSLKALLSRVLLSKPYNAYGSQTYYGFSLRAASIMWKQTWLEMVSSMSHTTDTAIVHHWFSVKHCAIDVAFLDFAKALDKVSHPHLINKLKSYGISDQRIE